MLFKMCTCTKENKKTVKYCVNQLQIDQELQDKKHTRKYRLYSRLHHTLTHTQSNKKIHKTSSRILKIHKIISHHRN